MTENSISPKSVFNDFVQVGAVVKDLDLSIQILSEMFGMGPFRIIDWPPTGRSDMQRVYHGHPSDFTARMAFVELGPIELELIQPLTGKSIWADFLAEHGPGIHHIRFNVTDVQPVIEHLAQQGIGVTQMGSGIRPGTTWANFDTEGQVGFTIEIMNALEGTNGRTPMLINGKVQE